MIKKTCTLEKEEVLSWAQEQNLISDDASSDTKLALACFAYQCWQRGYLDSQDDFITYLETIKEAKK